MVFIIPKAELPMVQYTPVKYKDENAMMAAVPNGVVILFISTDELVFVPWDEIVAYAVLAPRQKPELPKEDKKATVREIKKPSEPVK
jgi:hypothetical protein